MIEQGACPDFSQGSIIDVATCWLHAGRLAIVEDPWMAGLVAGSGLVTALISRSLAIGLAALLCAVLLVEPLTAVAEPTRQALRLGAAILALLLLWVGCLGYIRKLGRQRRSIADLSAEKNDVQARLEREVTWRRAAEPADIGQKPQ